MKWLCFLCVLFTFSTAKGQVDLDSLWRVWNDPQQHDTLRLWAIHTYCWEKYLYSRPDSTFYYAQKQYDFAKERGLTKHMANGMNNQGVSWAVRGDFGKALELFQKGLKINEEAGDKEGIASSQNNISNIYNFTGEYEKSYQALLIALENYEALGNQGGIGAAYNNLGNVMGALNRSDEELDYFKKGLKANKSAKDKVGIANSLSGIASTLLDRGEYQKALNYYDRAMVIEKETNNLRALSHAYANKGIAYKNMGELHQSLESYDEAIKLNETSGDKRGMAQSLMNKAMVYQILGDYEQAMESYERSYTMNSEMGFKKGVGRVLNNIGTLYQDLGENDKAIQQYEKALEVKRELGMNSDIANSLNSLGNVYRNEGKLQKAHNFYQEALGLFGEAQNYKGIVTAHINVGKVLKNMSDSAYAKENSSLSSDLLEKSMDEAETALTMAEEAGASLLRRDALLLKYRLYLAQGDLKSAIKNLDQALDLRKRELKMVYSILSEKEKELYVKTMEKDFWRMASLALVSKEEFPQITGDVYDNVIQTKGMLLKSSTAMRRAILNSGDEQLISEFDEWISLKKRIIKKYSEGEKTDSLEIMANELEKDLLQKSTEFSDIQKVQSLGWKDVQEGLNEDEAAIEFTRFLHAESPRNEAPEKFVYAALIIKKESKYPEMIRLFEESELQEILGDFPGNNLDYIEQVYGTKSQIKTNLYELIWQPLEESLEGVDAVHISPDGLLHKISFSALSKGKEVYLCDLHHIEVQSSTALLENSAYQMEDEMDISLFGGIHYSTDSSHKEVWSYLHGTKTELDRIVKQLEKYDHKLTVLSESEATEEKFIDMAKQSQILHIATHGFFFADPNEQAVNLFEADSSEQGELTFRGSNRATRSFVRARNPLMRSGLVFAGANSIWTEEDKVHGSNAEDGMLTAQEVVNLDMRHTDLVVLSACETGLGDIKGSEGVYGLQRSFKMAGVKHLIMSLWQVPDEETSEFMGSFYKNLLKLDDIQLAFNKTQREMRKKYDPYYWGAFVLIN